MTDKTTKFTVKSNKVLGEEAKQKNIVVDVPDTYLKSQTLLPSISVDYKQPNIKSNFSKKDIITNIDTNKLEVDIKGLGEERQPDGTRFIYKPDEISINDHQFSLIDKQAIPDKVGVKGTFIYFLKESDKFDEVTTPDIFSVDYSKPFFNSFSTEEFFKKELSKLAFDSAFSTEENTKLVGLNKFETLNTPEKVEQVFYKSIFDAISVTDDVNGILPDDDQTALIQDRNFDISGVEDFSYRHIFKGLVDTIHLVENFRAEDGTIKDDSAVVDIFIASLFKTADNDSAGTADTVALAPTSSRLDVATTKDILSTVITFLRSPVDTASAADSGRLNSQDYFSEEYVWEDYVGSNSYF